MFGLRKKSKSRPRILFVQKPPGGGSASGLYDLVAGIDKSLFEPIILFYEHNYYSDRFKELGVEVLHLNNSGNTTPATVMKRNIFTGNGLSSLNVYRLTKKIYRILFSELPVAWRISRILKANDIDISYASTMAFDGACFDKPQIFPYFAPDYTIIRNKEIRDLYHSEHYTPIRLSKLWTFPKTQKN